MKESTAQTIEDFFTGPPSGKPGCGITVNNKIKITMEDCGMKLFGEQTEGEAFYDRKV